MFLLISVLLLGVAAVATWPKGKVTVVFCDVGQGDGAIVIQNNFQMIIDAGPENGKMLQCLEKHVPFWDKTIEAAIISHGDADHVGGLKQIKAYYRLDEQNIYAKNLVRNDIIRSGEIEFEVVSPDMDWGDDNKNSVMGILRFGGHKILFTGDATTEVEQRLVYRNYLGGLGSGLKPFRTIIKVSHHGSAEGTSEELLAETQPDEAIISVGKNNQFGHPTKVVLERLEKFGVKIWRTDLRGERVVEW